MEKDSRNRVPAEQWLEEHGTVLYRYALLQLRDPDKAEEAVQETLLAALQAYANFSGQSSLRTWLIGILKHKILDQFRREAREQSLIDPDEPFPDEPFNQRDHWSPRLRDWGDPEGALQDSQFWRILQECLEHMPKRLARLFVMRELLEDETKNICQELTISPTNLWTMLYRARMRLRQCLDQNWVGESRRR